MKPFMMKFRQGSGSYERDIWVNMNQVCHITPNGLSGSEGGSVLTFSAVVGDEPAYIVVNESLAEIGNRPEWQR